MIHHFYDRKDSELRGSAKRVSKRDRAIQVILLVLVVAGAVSIAVIAPSILAGFAQLGLLPRSKDARKEHYIRKTVKRMAEENMVDVYQDTNGDTVVSITNTGRLFLAKKRLKDIVVERTKKWDGRWRIVSFDVRECKRQSRDELRNVLRSLGFVYVQRSLWAFPYPCDEVITEIAAALSIDDAVLYMTVMSTNKDDWLRKKFRL